MAHALTRVLAGDSDRVRVCAVALIAVFAALRIVFGGMLGLGTDEAYALALGHHLHLSYFDHPPLHIWIAHFSEAVFGDTRWARLPFIVVTAGTSWFMFALTDRLFGARAGFWALLAFSLAGYFSVAAGNWILPDNPLYFCLMAAAYALSPLVASEDRAVWRSWRLWLLSGLWIGLAALSKYHAVLFGVSLLAFLAVTREYRFLFRRVQPYAGIALAVLVFSPVLVWNADHGWASFLFQGARAGVRSGSHVGFALGLVAAQIGFILPWIAVPLAVAAAYAVTHLSHRRYAFLLMLGGPLIVFFTVAPLWTGAGLVHWPMPGWLLMFPLLGDFLARRADDSAWPKTWATASIILYLSLAAGALFEANTGWLGAQFPHLFRRGDPTRESMEWNGLRNALIGDRLLGRPNTIAVALSWRDAAKIDQAVGGAMRVRVASDDGRGFAFLSPGKSDLGMDAVVIVRPDARMKAMARLRTHFKQLVPLRDVVFGRAGRPEVRLRLYLGRSVVVPFAQGRWRFVDSAIPRFNF